MKIIRNIQSITFLAIVITMFCSCNAQPQSTTHGVKNIIFVHGAFADGSSWAQVIPLLQKQGYHVVSVQNPLHSLKGDVMTTNRAIEQAQGPVLLVGHSWAGMVITEAGNNPKVAGLLYVSALIPNDGQSVQDVVSAYSPAPGSAEFQLDNKGFLSLSYKGIDSFFAQDLPQKQRKILFATQTPWAAQATQEKISKAAWKSKPSWCIITKKDQMINPELERAEAKMINATTIELNASHVSMLSQPNKVADFIMDAAKELSKN